VWTNRCASSPSSAARTSAIAQRRVALALVFLAILLAVSRAWPFDASPPREHASLWQLLLADRLTLGFVRLALVAAALFLVASVPALVMGGRWLKVVGISGLTADDASDVTTELAESRREVDRLRKELAAVRKNRAQLIARQQGAEPSDG
jgi:hypothetical protein